MSCTYQFILYCAIVHTHAHMHALMHTHMHTHTHTHTHAMLHALTHAHMHTHTHTHILVPFEDHEPTGLKADYIVLPIPFHFYQLYCGQNV